MDGWNCFQAKEREGVVTFSSADRWPPWPAPNGSLESIGFPIPDHYSTRNQHQSNEKVNANTSTWFRKTTMDRGRDAAREGSDAIAGSLELLKLTILKHYKPKEEHGEGEKEMANSPKRRRKAQLNPQAPMTSNRYFYGFQPPTLSFT
jgi:hypothetical protein